MAKITYQEAGKDKIIRAECKLLGICIKCRESNTRDLWFVNYNGVNARLLNICITCTLRNAGTLKDNKYWTSGL